MVYHLSRTVLQQQPINDHRFQQQYLFIWLFIGLLLPVFKPLNGHPQEDQTELTKDTVISLKISLLTSYSSSRGWPLEITNK